MGNPDDPNEMPPWSGEMQYEYRWEQPAHIVHITKPFALGKTEVTRGQFASFVAATGQEPKNGCLGRLKGVVGYHEELSWKTLDFVQTDDHPVVCINRADAEAYMAWLSKLTGYTYRFPSEAEWEWRTRQDSNLQHLA
jgi:formylglycine-generating enzyme